MEMLRNTSGGRVAMEQFKTLGRKLGRHHRRPGDVAFGPGNTANKANADWIA
jgi:hypothetical protein